MFLLVSLFIASFAAPIAVCNTSNEIVYDSIPGASTGGFDVELNRQVGQRVHLAGDARLITGIEVRVRLHGLGISDPANALLSLYHGGGTATNPGALLWQGPGETFVYDPAGGGCCGTAIIGASVPSIAVPDSVLWTITRTSNSVNFLLSTNGDAPAAAVGSSGMMLRQNLAGGWDNLGNGPFAFTARISATNVPEPSVTWLVVLSSLWTAANGRKARR
jgi:hypothetical protein